MNKIKIKGEIDFLPHFEFLSFWKHAATSEECLRGQRSVLTGQLRSARDTPDPESWKAGWASSSKGHIYLSAKRGHETQQLPLSSTDFGKYFWLVWFYAFRVPFLSSGLVQTH